MFVVYSVVDGRMPEQVFFVEQGPHFYHHRCYRGMSSDARPYERSLPCGINRIDYKLILNVVSPYLCFFTRFYGLKDGLSISIRLVAE